MPNAAAPVYRPSASPILALALALAGCTADPPAMQAQPRHDVPANFCDRLDFRIASKVYGDPTPMPMEPFTETAEAVKVRCTKLFFGVSSGSEMELPGGAVSAQVSTFATAGKARDWYDKTPVPSTAAPFPGGSFESADAVRHQQSADKTTVAIRYGNLILDVEFSTFGRNGDLGDRAGQLPAVTAEFANNAFAALRTS